jgi:hypothetical protein
MGLSELFSFLGGGSASEDLPVLFPLSISSSDFVAIDVKTIYKKILTDTLERSQGLTDEQQAVLWDNCLMSESREGLVTLLAKAMIDKGEMFLVFKEDVLRKATSEEQAQIKADYEKTAGSKVGVYISFKNFDVSDMVKLYSAIDFCTVGSLYTSQNISKAVQIKTHELRSSTAMSDSAGAKAQQATIAKGLKEGKAVGMDAKDIVELAKPDLTATKSSMELTAQKMSFYLGLPASYITGVLNGGIGDTGQADSKAIDRGLKNYFFSIIKPVCKALFDKDLEFKSDDFQQLSVALEALKTFDITSGEFLSAESKLGVMNKILGLPESTKGDAPEEPVDPNLDPNAPPVDPNAPPGTDPKAKPPGKFPPGGAA